MLNYILFSKSFFNTLIEEFFLTILIVFNEFPFLNKEGRNFQEIFSNWKKYKCEVPVFGAIMLDELLENVCNFSLISHFYISIICMCRITFSYGCKDWNKQSFFK